MQGRLAHSEQTGIVRGVGILAVIQARMTHRDHAGNVRVVWIHFSMQIRLTHVSEEAVLGARDNNLNCREV